MNQVYKVLLYQTLGSGLNLINTYSEDELQQKIDELITANPNTLYLALDLAALPTDFLKYKQYYKISNGALTHSVDIKAFIGMQKNKWRKIRAAIFPILDIEFFKIMEIGSTSKYDRGQLSEWKQGLRDVTKDTHINTLTDIGQILSYTPPILVFLQNEFNIKAV